MPPNAQKNNFLLKDGKLRTWAKRTLVGFSCFTIFSVVIGGIFYSQTRPVLKIHNVALMMPQGHTDGQTQTRIEGDTIHFLSDFDTNNSGGWTPDPNYEGGVFDIDISIEACHGAILPPGTNGKEPDGYYHYKLWTDVSNLPTSSFFLNIRPFSFQDEFILNHLIIFAGGNLWQNDFYLKGTRPTVELIENHYFYIDIYLNLNAIFNRTDINGSEIHQSQKMTLLFQ